MIAQAVTAAVDGCSLAIAALPATEDPEFTERAAPILLICASSRRLPSKQPASAGLPRN